MLVSHFLETYLIDILQDFFLYFISVIYNKVVMLFYCLNFLFLKIKNQAQRW